MAEDQPSGLSSAFAPGLLVSATKKCLVVLKLPDLGLQPLLSSQVIYLTPISINGISKT